MGCLVLANESSELILIAFSGFLAAVKAPIKKLMTEAENGVYVGTSVRIGFEE